MSDEQLAVRTGPSVFDQLRAGILQGRFSDAGARDGFKLLSKDRAALAELIARDAPGANDPER